MLVCALGSVVRNRASTASALEAARPRSVGDLCLRIPGLVRPVPRPHHPPGGDRFRRARSPPLGRGRAYGRADHGLCVPIVTVVGDSWSVVWSGYAGFLKVSKYTF